MLFMFLLVAVAAFALGAASSPLLHRAKSCHLNFGGTTNQLEWNDTLFSGLGSDFINANDTIEWHWFSGQPTSNYDTQSPTVDTENVQLATERFPGILRKQAQAVPCTACDTSSPAARRERKRYQRTSDSRWLANLKRSPAVSDLIVSGLRILRYWRFYIMMQ